MINIVSREPQTSILEATRQDESARLKRLFPPNSAITYDADHGLWRIETNIEPNHPLGGQRVYASLHASSWSRTGTLKGFRIDNLTLNNEHVFDSLIHDFDLSIIPTGHNTPIEDDELALFDPNLGEILHEGLHNPENIASLEHELSHGSLPRRDRWTIYTSYKRLRDLTNDRSFMKEQGQIDRLPTTTDIDAKHLWSVILEELRANQELINDTRTTRIFPNDNGLEALKRFLGSKILTYVKGIQYVAGGNFFSTDQIQEITSLIYSKT